MPSRREAGPDADLGAARRTAWNDCSRLRTRRTGGPSRSAANATSGSSFGVLLAAEPAARVGRDHADLGQRQAQHLGQDPLQPVGMLDRAPDADPVAIGRRHERMRLDRELGHHREGVAVLDHQVGGRGIDVAPAHADARAGRCSTNAGRRAGGPGSWTSGASASSAAATVTTAGRTSCSTRTSAAACSAASFAVGNHDRHGLAVVLDLVDGDHGAVAELGAEARHRLGQVGSRHDQPAAGHPAGRVCVDRDDAGVGAVEGDELCLEHVRHADVRHVGLAARHPADAADAVGRAADERAHRSRPPATAWTASVICSYPAHRHRFPARPSWISATVGFGVRRRRSSAAISWPGMQKPHCAAP